MALKKPKHSENLNVGGNLHAPILVVCDAPHPQIWEEGGVIGKAGEKLFMGRAMELGLVPDDFCFITACPPMPDECEGSDSRKGKFVDTYSAEYRETIKQFTGVRLVVFMGALAGRQAMGRPIKITRIRGQIHEREGGLPMMGIFSPYMVLKRPEVKDIFNADLLALKKIKKCDFDLQAFRDTKEKVFYKWCLDLSPFRDDPPFKITMDTEFTGTKVMDDDGDDDDEEENLGKDKKVIRWYDKNVRVLTCQITTKKGTGLCIPLDCAYYPELTPKQRKVLIRDLAAWLGNPDVYVAGHSLNTDRHVLKRLGIDVANFVHEGMQLAFVVDENMQEKSLSEVTRRFDPDMAGYSDEFDAKTDKSRMDLVPHDAMLNYGCGDTDAAYRNTDRLVAMGRKDAPNWRCYELIQMPAIREFFNMEEEGMLIDTNALGELGVKIEHDRTALNAKLMRQVSPKVKRRHAEKGIKFSRPDFVRDVLFLPKSEGGFGLKAKVWTKTTRALKDESKRIPSISTKEHLPFFDESEWVRDLIAHQKMVKLEKTYVGKKGGELIPQRKKDAPPKYTQDTGFWKYLSDELRIHPSYYLHRTVTGRAASAYPNGQNYPKRGDLAKLFRKIFIPDPGWSFIEADLSQAELRIAAWMARERTMLRIYREGGDIHEATAAQILGIPLSKFSKGRKLEEPLKDHVHEWPGAAEYLLKEPTVTKKDKVTGKKVVRPTYVSDYCDYKRFQAKAVNFGFLYGMGWRKFMSYAKTDYGITFTEEEAKNIRAKFFSLFSGLPLWHKEMIDYVNAHGFVRSLHGALRRLPNIYSPDDAQRSMAERQAINSPVQRFASDLGLIGLSRFGRDCDRRIMRPVAFIHDAVIVKVRTEHLQEAASALKWYMQTPPLKEWFGLTPPLPILSDVSASSLSLGDMEELKGVEAVCPSWYQPECDALAA